MLGLLLLLLGCLSALCRDYDVLPTFPPEDDIHTLLSDMRDELQKLQEELKAAVDRLQLREHEVHVLQKHNEDRRVAFSASLLDSGDGFTGPYNDETSLTYTHVITNVGNGYNKNTGFFTAAVRGVYQFSFFLHGHGGSAPIAARLVRNGQPVVNAWASQPEGSVNPSNGVSLLLEAGDVVCVKLLPNKRIYDDRGNYNTFSGHLLFTM